MLAHESGGQGLALLGLEVALTALAIGFCSFCSLTSAHLHLQAISSKQAHIYLSLGTCGMQTLTLWRSASTTLWS